MSLWCSHSTDAPDAFLLIQLISDNILLWPTWVWRCLAGSAKTQENGTEVLKDLNRCSCVATRRRYEWSWRWAGYISWTLGTNIKLCLPIWSMTNTLRYQCTGCRLVPSAVQNMLNYSDWEGQQLDQPWIWIYNLHGVLDWNRNCGNFGLAHDPVSKWCSIRIRSWADW